MSLHAVIPAAFLALFLACHPAKPVTEKTLDVLIHAQLPEAEVVYNASKDFVLCLSKHAEPATGRKEYLVIEVATRKIITRGSFMPGSVKWLNNDELELIDAAGVVTNAEPPVIHKTIINIRTPKS
jgi:hypothetical protein